jgi:hypothetical protein
MNWHTNSNKIAATVRIAALFLMALPAMAAPVDKAAAPEAIERSVFVLPTNPNEGRDPFFPNSNRPYEAAAAAEPHVANLSSLVLKGISGPPEHRLVIINNRTLAVGDEADLATTQGRIHIRCIEIKADSVIIESSNQRQQLTYPNGH